MARWLQFASDAPKGFGKFFDKKDGPAPAKNEESKPESEEPSPRPKREAKPKEPKEPKEKEFEFKFEFGGAKKSSSGGGGGGGKIPGDGMNRQQLYLYGSIAVGTVLGLFALQEIVYEEIGWQEFVTK